MNLFHKQEAMHLIPMVGSHRDMVSWAFDGKEQNQGETEKRKKYLKLQEFQTGQFGQWTIQINLYRQNQ